MAVQEWSAIVINDDYEHTDNNLEYVLENVLNDDTCDTVLKHKYNSVLLNRCHCCGVTASCSNCLHGGNYVVDSTTGTAELVLNNKQKQLIYECSSLCSCSHNKCLNRLVQNGPRKNLKIIDSQVIGSKGLQTTANIPEGGFICEYAGELLTRDEALCRTAANESAGHMNYILCLREKSTENEYGATACEMTIIDPSQRGNIGRYINHSCAPNCEVYSVRVDCPVPKVAIFAKRFIKAGEELFFHYGEGLPASVVTQDVAEQQTNFRTPCLCGAKNCAGFLPNIKF